MKKLIFTLLAVSACAGSFAQNRKSQHGQTFLNKTRQAGSSIQQQRTAALKCYIDSSILRTVNNSQLQNSNRTVFAYNSGFLENLQTRSSWNSSTNKWSLSSRMYTAYNGNGDVTLELTEFYSSITNTWVPSSNFSHSFDAQNRVVSDLYQSYNTSTSAWKNVSRMTYTYTGTNTAFSIQVEETWNNTANNWVNSNKTTCTVNAQQQVTDVEGYLWSVSANSWQIDYRMTSITYDLLGNMVSYTEPTWNGTAWVNDARMNATYTGTYVTQELYQEWLSNAWVNYYKSDYSYDVNKNQVSFTDYDWNNNQWQNSSRILNTFDSNNNQVNSTTDSWNTTSNKWVNYSATGGFFNCTTVGLPENGTGTTVFGLYPNPAQSSLYIKTSAGYAAINIVSLTGQTVLSAGANTQLIVAGLAPGVYFVSLLNGSGQVLGSAKFIKE